MERRSDWSIYSVRPLGLVMICDDGEKGIRTSSVKVMRDEPELTVMSRSPNQIKSVLVGPGVSREDFENVLVDYLEIFDLCREDAVKLELSDLETTNEVHIPFRPAFSM